ncbi:DUF2510 domain-containing protein [Rhodococcus sp. BP-241]|uniref:DUF2510 domain-containing protein n=1 Tax=Rhodococcus sp. BP-241 TaxID=2739441 RepID=UPI001C9B7875|nr:DUF2510 domain-containing protein [Rhodococcus sp. BP-241]MBY6706206.1 DUF2510 domain-containing protein [Rhodococcus sp. BP-241]
MSNPQNAAPGWYPTPDGGQQYWDGNQWLSLPNPSSNEQPSRTPRVSRKRLVISGLAVLIVLVIAGGSWKISHDSGVREQQEAAQAAQDARDTADRLEAKRIADIQAEQEEKDGAARAGRALSVVGIESSVKQMAEGHVEKGLVDGPIIDVTCSPVSGGSTDDLTETTTVFECFAANEDNGDGTMSGYKYNATMNWTTGSYTYGLGAP